MVQGKRPVLVWTRSRKDLAVDQALLQPALDRGLEVLTIPCIELRPMPLLAPKQNPDYVVVTSSHAAECMAAAEPVRQAVQKSRQVYTHGAKTAEVLTRLGIAATLVPGVATAAELCAWLGQTLASPAHVWLPIAAEPAFDMAAGLSRFGLSVDSLPCYDNVAMATEVDGQALSVERISALSAAMSAVPSAICFASPSAVSGFCRVFKPEAAALRRHLRAVAIGPTTKTAALPYFDQISLAPHASLEALVAAACAVL